MARTICQTFSALLVLAFAAGPIGAQQPVNAASTPQGVGQSEPAPATGPYQPSDKDERGLWMQMDEAEREMRNSPMVIHDTEFNAYVRGVLCKVAGQAQCRDVRLYVMRTPYFNATMAPNGMMQVWSGLLLRTQNEAQLAAVLGHEYTHYENRHSLKLFRDLKKKSNAAVWLGFTGIGLIASLSMLSSIFAYSREMEREADTGGLAKMAAAGYDTREAALVWEHLREEMDATAAARNTKSKKDKDKGLFATHPPTAERVKYLTEAAAGQPGTPGEDGAQRFAQAMAKLWPAFVDDQLKMNDFGSSDYLIGSLARTGWTPALLYARGELYRRRAGGGDVEAAVGFYRAGIEAGGGIAELWKGRGLALMKLGQTEAGQADLREYLRLAPEASDRAMIAMMAGETK